MKKKMTQTNAQLQARKTKVMARGQGNVYPVYVEQAKNAELWDVEGKRLLILAQA